MSIHIKSLSTTILVGLIHHPIYRGKENRSFLDEYDNARVSKDTDRWPANVVEQ